MVKWNKDLFLDQPTVVEESLVGSSDSRPVKVHYLQEFPFILKPKVATVAMTHMTVSCLLLYPGTFHILLGIYLVSQFRYGTPLCMNPMMFIVLFQAICL